MKLTFLGATETVTGSKYLLESGDQKILVDCGLFQGLKELRLRNWETLPVNPADISAILLTHAHLDHSGYIPKFVKDGFKGKIYCSEATADLCKILLVDSGRIQEDDAERANRYGYTKHQPALALYTAEDAENALAQFYPVPYAKKLSLNGGNFEFSLHRAGHILGATSIRVEAEGGTSILFSGDLGRINDPIMKPPVEIQPADYLVVESTYGDRVHDKSNPADDLESIINRTVQRGGSVIIPAFAVGRAQSLLYYIHQLKEEKRIPASLPVYLDSPMAVSATELLHKYLNDHRLPHNLCKDVCEAAKYTRTKEQSMALDSNNNGVPKIIISASGMATGGRVLHHLTHYLGDRRSTIVLAGYQAAGTRGDRLARGEDSIKIFGKF
jgi:metallo-beta-lactamase family protein